MSNTTIVSLIVIILMIVVIFTGINLVANDIQNNPNLDLRSKVVITNFNNQVSSNYNLSQFTTTTDNNTISTNSTCSGVDAFFRQSCIDTNTISEQKSTIGKITSFPTFIVNILGFDTNDYFKYIIGLFILLLSILIGFAIYKALRTGEVD